MPDPVTRLNTALEGRYTIDRELGEGGMATVYLAKDLKHNRNVALKVLKPELAAVVGADRFLAEIETTANLQHPHILPLFDSGEADSFLYYVMPYIEGETLADRIAREKQLPVDEALGIATAVANALQTAHDAGVVHRDIKPANILLSRAEPLVADFGIALAVGAAGGSRLTETGLSVGTPYYMSPEQATGDQALGPASDTYALACVLYEMLVGEPPYLGNTAQAVLGKIIQGLPVSASAVRKSIPLNVDAAIRRALEKLPADRFTGAQDFAKALADTSFRHGEASEAATVGTAASWRTIPTVTGWGLAILLALASGWGALRPAPPAPIARFPAPFLPGQHPTGGMEFTPDGAALVYRAAGLTGVPQLWVRRWDNLEAIAIGNTEGALDGWFQVSPDGQDVAFKQGPTPGPVRVAPIAGGPARTVVDGGAYTVNGWDAEGNVYFGQFGRAGISGVPATGGEIESITEASEDLYHTAFRVLPGDRVAVFQAFKTSQSGEDAEIWSVDLESGATEFVVAGGSPRYAVTGHLLFSTPQGTLMGAPIDASTGQLTGPAVPLVEGLATNPATGTTDYAVSETGRLVYMTGAGGFQGMEFVWADRQGSATALDEDGEAYDLGLANFGWRLSPDGTKLAFQRTVDGNTDIWIKEMPDGAVSRLTFDPAAEWMPQWRPDGEVVTFRSERSGDAAAQLGHLWSQNADGTGEASLLFDAFNVVIGVWSPDQEWLVLRQAGRDQTSDQAARDILLIRPGVDEEARPLVATGGFWEQGPAISRDGRWLAHSSNETGRHEIFVRPFPNVDDGKWQVSTGGGIRPVWAHNGQELFFANPETRELVSAVFEADEAVFRRVELHPLFTIPDGYLMNPTGIADFYDVDLEDERFLMARPKMSGEEDTRSTVLVENFFEELNRLVPN